MTGRLLGREQGVETQAHLDLALGGKVGSRAYRTTGPPTQPVIQGRTAPRTGRSLGRKRPSTRRSGVSTQPPPAFRNQAPQSTVPCGAL